MTIKIVVKNIYFEIECNNASEASEFINTFVENNRDNIISVTGEEKDDNS